MNPWTIAFWIIGMGAALYALHRLALWAEREGWIRYIKNPPRASDGSGAAMGELQKFFEPQTKHVYEIKDQKRPLRQDESGEGDPDKS